MLKRETGTVVRLEGDKAVVRIRGGPRAACGPCKASHASGADFVLHIDAGNLTEGDQVTVEVPEPGPWRAIGLVLALPLAALVAGVVAGSEWRGLQRATGLGPEAAAVVLGAVLLAAALVAALAAERRFARRHRPRLIETRPRR